MRTSKKEKVDKIIKYGLLIDFIFVIVLISNFYAFAVNSSEFLRITIIIELIAIMILKNYLKSRMIKRVNNIF